MIKNYTGAYVINLEANQDRKKKFLKEWNKNNKINVVKAVDTRGNLWENYKQHISEKAIKELKETIKNKKRKSHESLTEGAVGCYLSHLKCWRKFLKESTSNDDYCLILEDDSTIPKDLIKTTKDIVDKINSEWGIILLGWRATSQYSPFNEDLVIPNTYAQLHAYLLSNFGARKLLEIHDKIEIQLDHFVSKNTKKIKTLGIINDICTQGNTCGYTNIQTYSVN
jgi:GR25 family glycosyltransferase involved in LPS biosynthesis